MRSLVTVFAIVLVCTARTAAAAQAFGLPAWVAETLVDQVGPTSVSRVDPASVSRVGPA